MSKLPTVLVGKELGD